MHVYSVATERFIRHRQCIWEIKARFYHHWLLKYPLTCAPAVPVGAHTSEDISIYNKPAGLRLTAHYTGFDLWTYFYQCWVEVYQQGCVFSGVDIGIVRYRRGVKRQLQGQITHLSTTVILTSTLCYHITCGNIDRGEHLACHRGTLRLIFQ